MCKILFIGSLDRLRSREQPLLINFIKIIEDTNHYISTKGEKGRG